jgi:catechol 2,3-dioxygenase-like lactoylglutathione lyase family enzyme
MRAKLVPELDVADLGRPLAFYVGIVGFQILYDRPEERFAYLGLDGVELMLEEAAGPGRRFHTAPLEHPFGRGVNFQIAVGDVVALHARILAAHCALVIPLEERWYRRGVLETGNRQFVVADPDGYLLRFYSGLGTREVPGSPPEAG